MALAYFFASLCLFCWIGASRLRRDAPSAEGEPKPLVFLTLVPLVWCGTVWILAAVRLLHTPGLLAIATLWNLASVWMGFKGFRGGWTLRRPDPARVGLAGWITGGVLGLLVVFNLFKGYVLPTANTDANAWSMPIAVYYMLGKGLDLFTPPQAEWLGHLSDPNNYELMLSSILALQGSDRVTEWFATACAVGILATVWGLFSRWHGSGAEPWVGLLLFAASPVFLLHMAADKADLLTGLLTLLGLFWTVRHWDEGRPRQGLLACYTLFMLAGTKKVGWVVAPILLAVLGLRILLRRGVGNRVRSLVHLLAHAGVAFLLLGGLRAIFLWIHARPGQAWAAAAGGPSPGYSLLDSIRFLWMVAWHPFRSGVYDFTPPFSAEAWYWPGYNLIYSHFGWWFGPLLLLALLAGVLARKAWRLWYTREQVLFAALSGACFFALFLRRYAYDGGFNTYPRFTFFLLVPILSLGLLTLLGRWAGMQRHVTRNLVLGVCLANLLASAGVTYTKDMTAPLQYFSDLWRHPERRRWVFVGLNRLPCRLDRVAGPKEVIATDCTFQTWLHPLWGEGFTRRVELIPWERGRAQVPPDADWVLADNVSGITFGGQGIRSAGEFLKTWNQGQPSDRDTALFRQVRNDPAWELVFATPLGEQCLFRRKR